MKVKQTVRTLVMSALLLLFGASLVIPADSYAESCGGVQTAIISCAQKGICADGSNAFVGSKPGTSAEIAAYTAANKHPYGTCLDGKPPTTTPESTGVFGILLLAINILTAGVGVAAIGGIVYGSILYTSAGGSPEQVKKAVGIITNVVIGVIAYALMFSLLNFIIPGGLFH